MSAEPVPFNPQLVFRYEPREYIDACPLCSYSVFTVVAHWDRYGYQTETMVCERCGLGFLNPRLSKDEYREFYETGKYRDLVKAWQRKPTTQPQERETFYALELLIFLAPFIKGHKTLLDIGGSSGVVAREVSRAFGLEATVLDPAAKETMHTSLEVIPGLIEDWEPQGRKFDVVTICQTIDHVLDPRAALTKAREVLNPDGLLFVDIVDFLAVARKEGRLEAAVKIDHPLYWSEASAAAALTDSGFRVLRRNYQAGGRHVGFACAPIEDHVGQFLYGGFGVIEQIRDLQTRRK